MAELSSTRLERQASIRRAFQQGPSGESPVAPRVGQTPTEAGKAPSPLDRSAPDALNSIGGFRARRSPDLGGKHRLIRALVADDHAVVRRGLRELLAESREVAVTGEVGTAQEALEKIRSEKWDVLVLDINLPDQNGLDLLLQVKQEKPD